MNEIKKIWLPLSDRFYRVAYHILESQEDAEDAVLMAKKAGFSNINIDLMFSLPGQNLETFK